MVVSWILGVVVLAALTSYVLVGLAARHGQKLGMVDTTVGANGWWGLTSTTAADQVRALKSIMYGSATLSKSSRSYLRGLMRTVVSTQDWGVSGGVPASATVELKNGWVWTGTSEGVRINSVGHIAGSGRDYVIAIMSRNNPSMPYGVDTVEGVSRLVWATLTKPLR